MVVDILRRINYKLDMSKKLVKLTDLSIATGIPVRTLRSLYQTKKISFIRAGWRTLLFDTDKVLADLGRLEVKAVSHHHWEKTKTS